MPQNIHTSAIIVAAGKGKRMNFDIPKQYMNLNGKPILAYTIEKFQECKDIDDIVLVVNKDDVDYCKDSIICKFNFSKVRSIVKGGNERQYSVYNGLNALEKKTNIVLIHDGVRPFVEAEHITNIIKETINFNCCVLGVKVKDTIKICSENGIVKNTPKREDLWSAQTPQSFKYETILNIYKRADEEKILGTDDSMLAEKFGYTVKMIKGSYNNIKITTPEDLDFAKSILSQ